MSRWEPASCVTNSSFVDKGKVSSASISGTPSALPASVFLATQSLLKSQDKLSLLLNGVVHPPHLCLLQSLLSFPLGHSHSCTMSQDGKQIQQKSTCFESFFSRIIPRLVWLHSQTNARGKIRGWEQEVRHRDVLESYVQHCKFTLDLKSNCITAD